MTYDIYEDIATRTGGEIYVGVVGPVRTGKSTLITKFMEKLVLPSMSVKYKREIATDEMPQSAGGRTIMTTSPKFVPGEAVKISVGEKATASVRLIDCVGYFVDGALGDMEDAKPRMVSTPWEKEDIPFERAAEIGTEKVIKEHATIGIVVTTDGSIGEIGRESYIPAEERVISELKEYGKPFVVVLNCKNPVDIETASLRERMQEKYDVPVLALNVLEMGEENVNEILERILYEFPLRNIDVELSGYLKALPPTNPIIKDVLDKVLSCAENMSKMRDYVAVENSVSDERFNDIILTNLDLGKGKASFMLDAKPELFYKVLSSECGVEIENEFHLINYIKNLSVAKVSYEKMKDALMQAEESGYGVVIPSVSDMTLDEPTLVKQGSRYGIKLKATAPSLHILKVDVTSEVSPIVGSQEQSEDMIKYLSNKYETDKKELWETNIFGKTLNNLVCDGLSSKCDSIPEEVKGKLRRTMSRIVNEGKGGVLCILL